jgi:hypothetical protein
MIATARVAAFLIGFALGAEIDLIAYLTARYFGLRNFGFMAWPIRCSASARPRGR